MLSNRSTTTSTINELKIHLLPSRSTIIPRVRPSPSPILLGWFRSKCQQGKPTNLSQQTNFVSVDAIPDFNLASPVQYGYVVGMYIHNIYQCNTCTLHTLSIWVLPNPCPNYGSILYGEHSSTELSTVYYTCSRFINDTQQLASRSSSSSRQP